MALSDLLAARSPATGAAAPASAPWKPGEPGPSADFRRILALPRRPEPPPVDLTPLFARPGGGMQLRPIQSAALAEAAEARGLLALVGVGHGKTLVSLLLGAALEARQPLLLVPAQVRGQLLNRDMPELSRHWFLPPGLRIMSYEELSTAKSTSALETLAPDLIIADEAHKLRHRDATRTRRFLRYFRDHPGVQFCALSGTLAGASIEDYAHLAGLALGEGSPLPLDRWEARNWAAALDVHTREPVGPGVLRRFGEPVREGYRRRLLETQGVIATSEASIGASLLFEAWDFRAPPAVERALAELAATWTTPAGEELEDALALRRSARQISQGFYYRWVWPDETPDFEWLEARAQWHKALREFLTGPHAGAGRDSPLLLAREAIAGRAPRGVQGAWPAWDAVRHREPPPVEAVWIDDGLVRAAAAWARTNPGIVWYEHEAIGSALRAAGVPTFGPGPEDGAGLLREKGTRGVAASLPAHGTGKNLQPFSRNLFLCPPSGGAVWEQAIGRTHRQGQEAEEVVVVVARHAEPLRKAWESATEEAAFVAETTGTAQRLLFGSRGF